MHKEESMLRITGLKPETESHNSGEASGSDHNLNQKHIVKQNADSRCRLCHRSEKYISHIIAG